MYALEAGIALPERSADTNALLGALMKQLEVRHVVPWAPARALAAPQEFQGPDALHLLADQRAAAALDAFFGVQHHRLGGFVGGDFHHA